MLPSNASNRLGSRDVSDIGARYTPHAIAVYASPAGSLPRPQHSLPGGRYPLPGPDFHRLDTASHAGALDARHKAHKAGHDGAENHKKKFSTRL